MATTNPIIERKLPDFFIADRTPKLAVEKIIFLCEGFFLKFGHMTHKGPLFARATLRVTIYSVSILVSFCDELMGQRPSQGKLRTLLIAAIASSFFHPLTPLDIPPHLFACDTLADEIISDFGIDSSFKREILKAVVIKTYLTDHPDMVERLYGVSSKDPIDSAFVEFIEQLFSAPQANWPKNAPYYLPLLPKVLNFFKGLDQLTFPKTTSREQSLAVYYKYARDQILSIIDDIPDHNLSDQERSHLVELKDRIDMDVEYALFANLAQLLELLPEAPFVDKLHPRRSEEMGRLRTLFQEPASRQTAVSLFFSFLFTSEQLKDSSLSPIESWVRKLATVFYQPCIYAYLTEGQNKGKPDPKQTINVFKEILEHVD